MKLPSFLRIDWWHAQLQELQWRLMCVSKVFLDDRRRLFYCWMFPALHLTTLGLLLFLAIHLEDNKGIYFTRVACFDRLAYKNVCVRYLTNGSCDKSQTLHESIWLREKYLLGYIYDQVESIFPENSTLGDNLKHTDLVGNLTLRQYRVVPVAVDSDLPGASASPEWSEHLQNKTPPHPNLFPFPSYNHTRSFRSTTTTYGYTPHAYVVMSSVDTRNTNVSHIHSMTMERVKAMQDVNWVDANSRTVVMQAAFHKQDDNVFVHLSIVYEKKGDYWKFTTQFLGAHLSTYFVYPNEKLLQQFAHTDNKLFVSNTSHLITIILPTLLFITLFQIMFETRHLYRLQPFSEGFRVFALNIIMAVLQIIVITWATIASIHLKDEVDKHFGNFYNMDIYPLLRSAKQLTQIVIIQILIQMLKQVYMPAYFHPEIDDLLRRVRKVVPVLCVMMVAIIVTVSFFGALMASRMGWGSLTASSIEVFATIIEGPEYCQYGFIYFPLVLVFLFILVPFTRAVIVVDADNLEVGEVEVVAGPITPSQLRQRRLRQEVRYMMENVLSRTPK